MTEDTKTLNKIDGMYAFAYWDGEKLWLVRDKVGEKFLYWTINEYGIFFSSEIKGIFKLKVVKLIPNNDNINALINPTNNLRNGDDLKISS